MYQPYHIEMPPAVDLHFDQRPRRIAAGARRDGFIRVDSQRDRGGERPGMRQARQFPDAGAALLGRQIPERAVQGIARAAGRQQRRQSGEAESAAIRCVNVRRSATRPTSSKCAFNRRTNRVDLGAEQRYALPIVVHPRRLPAADMAGPIGERDDDDVERRLGAARHSKRHFVGPGLGDDAHRHGLGPSHGLGR